MSIREWLQPLFPDPEKVRIEEAEERWRRRNAQARADGCPCGRPGTVVRCFYGNVGRVPVEFWTCANHVGVDTWMRMGDVMEPRWSHPEPCPLGQTYGSGGPIGGPPDHFYCSHREHGTIGQR